MDSPKLEFNYYRKFGVEIELNAFDGKSRIDDKMPEGIHYVGNLVSKITGEYVELRKWSWTNWGNPVNGEPINRVPSYLNGYWVVKPDGSCGIEVCSPVMKGWTGLMDICRVVDGFGKDERIKADERCSVHVHVDVGDCTKEEVARILLWWVKCEPVFMDAFPDSRKNNKYCQFIGLWDWLRVDTYLDDKDIINLLGRQKYLTANSYHMVGGRRRTLEFRLGDSGACKNSYVLKNIVRLIIHFVEMARNASVISYSEGNPWSGWCWLDPRDVFSFLGFNGNLSEGMKQVRNWFLARMVENMTELRYGVQSLHGRKVAHSEVFDMIEEYFQGGRGFTAALLPVNMDYAVYDDFYKL
jgi:hypothetical protein